MKNCFYKGESVLQNSSDNATIAYKETYFGGAKMDRITKGFLEEFSLSFGYANYDESLQFEYFSNYCALSAESSEVEIDIQNMYTGDSTQGIDGIAIEVNGTIVESLDDIEHLISQNKRLDVKFILVQAKTSNKFNNGEIANYLTFAESFFSDNAKGIFKTSEMLSFIEMKDYIYDNSKYMKAANPRLDLFYVSLGKWNDQDININTVINSHVEALEQSNLFSKVRFIPCDAQIIQSMYRKSQQQLSATFTFSKKVMMFSDDNGDYGYSGVLPFSEFKKIICDDGDSLKKVFEDNIRDYLGEKNYVNEDIENTIFNGGNSAFCMLNNGITIVANSAVLVSDKMTIDDYQIVNGCQTSHVLFSNRSSDGINLLLIPVKIIVTKNEELKNKITKATNNQTSITKEQLEALSSYQKQLEEYYKTFTNEDEKLYYERRSGQYRNESVPKKRIISIRTQIKNASAMFNEKPHDSAGHYSTLIKDIGVRLFNTDDKPSLYYTSSLAMFRYENLIKTKVIDKKYSKGKYHAIMLLKYMFGDIPKYYNAKKIDNFCAKIQKVLNDPNKCLIYFTRIINYINSQNLALEDRKLFERKETTDMLLKNVSQLIKGQSISV